MEKKSMFSLNSKESSPKSFKCAFSGRLEIHLCVLQDIGPFGPLPKKHQPNQKELFSCVSKSIRYSFSYDAYPHVKIGC